MFQFDPADMSLRPGPRQVVRELVGPFDDWEVADWFAAPNAWLDDFAPVDLIDHEPSAVLDAERADRFVALG